MLKTVYYIANKYYGLLTITSREYKHNPLKLWENDHRIYGNFTIDSKLLDSKFLYDSVKSKLP